MRRRRLVVVAGAVTIFCACQKPRTEIVLTIDSNLVFPTELDQIHVAVTAENSSTRFDQMYDLGISGTKLPIVLGLVPGADKNMAFRADAQGLSQGVVVVERSAVTSFVADQTLALYLNLLRVCAQKTCPLNQTCGDDGRCSSETIVPATLPKYGTTRDAGLLGVQEAGASPVDGRDESSADFGASTAEVSAPLDTSKANLATDSVVSVIDAPRSFDLDTGTDASPLFDANERIDSPGSAGAGSGGAGGGAGGVSGAGGRIGSGGATSTDGIPGTGGVSGTGGGIGTGGAQGTGGAAIGTGGSMGTGGATGTGGTKATGGTNSVGGSTNNVGGATGNGGTNSLGGVAASGGSASAVGGKTSTGGSQSTGGASASAGTGGSGDTTGSGGANASGGKSPSGGGANLGGTTASISLLSM